MVLAPPPMDSDVEEFFAAQKRARARAFVRGMKMLAVMAMSSVLAIGTGVFIAKWDHDTKVRRLERYRAGEVVVLRRNERVTNTDPDPRLPLVAGIAVGVLVFALGAALVLKDKTYLRAFGSDVGA
jgi:hypothetical protein